MNEGGLRSYDRCAQQNKNILYIITMIIESIDEICIYGEINCPNLLNEISRSELKYHLYRICIEGTKSSDYSFSRIDDRYSRLSDSDIKPVIEKNLPSFGYYHVALNSFEDSIDPKFGLGDPIDDLCDIIKDLSEVKWRIINLGISDGISYLRFMFKAHTEDHIIGLIGYMNEIQ